MTNDAKHLLMQYLNRFAEHEHLHVQNPLSFKKHELLLEQLKQKNHESWAVITNLINAFIREDRITNDQEKKDKAFPLWQSEHAQAEHEKVNAEMELISYCRQKGIAVGTLSSAPTEN